MPFRNTLVRSIAEDRDQNLWIGTIGAGLAFAGKDGRLIRYNQANGFPSNDVTCVAPDRKGSLWACTGAGLVELSKGRIRVITIAVGLPENRVRATCEASEGTRWVAGSDFGLSRSSGSGFTRFEGIPGAADAPITALQCASDGSVWAGTGSGLYRIRGNTVNRFTVDRFTSAQGLADDNILSLAESGDGTLLIGSRYGVSRYRNGEFDAYSTTDGLSHSSVLSIFCLDREGSLWVGHPNGTGSVYEPAGNSLHHQRRVARQRYERRSAGRCR